MSIPINWRTAAIVFVGLAASMCGGCASGPNSADPWEKVNRFIYNFNDGLDRVALKPLADGYVKVVPSPIRSGIGNGFDNLVYFNVVFNDFLQGKTGQGLGDFGRMAANSTIGIGGIFDVATNWGLPAHENDFGITLGKWGAGPGPYIVLPLFGPSSLRDAPGLGVEYLATPTTWLNLPWQIFVPLFVTDTVDKRSRFDSVVRFRNAAAVDPYVFTREAYLQYREGQIHEGKTATDQGFYDQDMDTAPAATRPASTKPASTQSFYDEDMDTAPAATRPASTQPVSTKPPSTQGFYDEDMDTAPAATRPASTRPASTQPSSTQGE